MSNRRGRWLRGLGLALLVALMALAASDVYALGLAGPVPDQLTMEYGSSSMVTASIGLFGGRFDLNSLSFHDVPGGEGPQGSLWISWSPTEEVRAIETSLRGWYSIYIKDPSFWLPPGGFVGIRVHAEEIPDSSSGGITAIVAVETSLRLYLTGVPEDNVVPSASVVVTGKCEPDSTYSSDVHMSWSATGDFSGAGLYWQQNGGPWCDTREVTLCTPGAYHFDYYAVDGAGNESTVQSVEFTINRDMILPLAFEDSGQRLGGDFTRDQAVADLDLDGDLDLICCNWGGLHGAHNGTRVYMNNGSGYFTDSGQMLDPNRDFSRDGLMGHVAAGDLNGDGYPDLAIADYTWNLGGVFVFYNDGTGDFTGGTGFARGTCLTSLQGCDEVTIFDINGDGLNDILFDIRPDDAYGGERTYCLINAGSGGFVLQDAPEGMSFDYAVGRSVGDLDLDGDLDCIGLGHWLASVGAGYYATMPYAGPSLNGGECWTLGDIDGDGDLDALSGVFGGSNYVYFSNASQAIIPEPLTAALLGLGIGALALRRGVRRVRHS